MKPVIQTEFENILAEIQTLVGSQLQEIIQAGKEVGLAFYHDREMHWLWFDFSTHAPVMLMFQHHPPKRKKETKPLVLFARSHFVGKRLEHIEPMVSKGRVFRLHFFAGTENHRKYWIEIRLYPHASNMIFATPDKSLSFAKVAELQAPPTEFVKGGARTWNEIKQEWLGNLNQVGTESLAVAQKTAEQTQTVEQRVRRDWEKLVSKKLRAIEKIELEISKKQSSEFAELGHWLKTHLTLENVPEPWSQLIVSGQPLSWNIENLFRKAKDAKRKLAGTEDRLKVLQKELEELKGNGPNLEGQPRHATRKNPSSSQNKSALAQAKAKGRKLSLTEDVDVYIGKSATDNLALLRRAQPFDLWLHLRDYPGAHAIIKRPKTRLISDDELRRVSQWLAEESLHKSATEIRGDRFDVLVVECRYVRPIKGDKHGRVTFTNDRVFSFRAT